MFILGTLRKFYLLLEASVFDYRTIDKDLPNPKYFNHTNGVNWMLSLFDKPNFTILEIGSKEVTGKSILKEKIINAKYIGLDIQEGRNVDIVADAHELSKKIKENSIDCIYSSSVFEHLYAPWLVAEEISKVLKLDGHVFIETHFTYQAHERPFNFFNCSDLGLKALFNKSLGFETIDFGLDLPLRARFNIHNPKYLRMKELYSAMSHSYFVGKKIKNINLEKYTWLNADPNKEDKSKYYPKKTDSNKDLYYKN
tara:strand:- start:1103 stop:1864 length:762 start_codon:yes stop_codon:yes gene_type:complete